jgi:hypothetical protein
MRIWYKYYSLGLPVCIVLCCEYVVYLDSVLRGLSLCGIASVVYGMVSHVVQPVIRR